MYTQKYAYAHIYKHTEKIFTLQRKFEGDAGLLVVTNHFCFAEPGFQPVWVPE